MKQSKTKKRELIVWGIIILYAIIFSIYAYFTLYHIMDSDIGSVMLISRTLGDEHNFLMSKSIIYNTEIRLFDVQNLAGIVSCFTNDWRLYTVIANGIFLAAFCYVIFRISLFIIKNENNEKAAYIISLICALFTCFPYSKNYYYIGLGCGYYLGKYLLEALLVLFTLLMLKKPKFKDWKYVALLLLSALAGVKGVRYMLVIYIPICIALFIIFVAEIGFVNELKLVQIKEKLGKEKLIGATIIGTSIVAYLAGYVFNLKILNKMFSYASYTGITFGDFGESSLAERAAELLAGWFDVMGYRPKVEVFSLDGIANVLILAAFGSFVYCTVFLFKRFAKLNFISQFILLFVNISIIFNSYVFLVTDEFVARYYTPIYIFIFLIVSVYLNEKDENAIYKLIVSCILCIYMLVTCITTVKVMNAVDNISYRMGSCDFLLENGYTFGYATFWNANFYSGLTDGKIEMAGITDPGTMEAYRWNTLEKYYERDYCKEKTFILLTTVEYEKYKDSQVIQSGDIVYQDSGYVIVGYANSESLYDLVSESKN